MAKFKKISSMQSLNYEQRRLLYGAHDQVPPDYLAR